MNPGEGLINPKVWKETDYITGVLHNSGSKSRVIQVFPGKTIVSEPRRCRQKRTKCLVSVLQGVGKAPMKKSATCRIRGTLRVGRYNEQAAPVSNDHQAGGISMGLSRRRFFKVSTGTATMTMVEGVLACTAPSSNGVGLSERSARPPALRVVQDDRRSRGSAMPDKNRSTEFCR